MIANSLIYVRFNAWLLKSEYTIVTSLQPNTFKRCHFQNNYKHFIDTFYLK